MLVATQARPQPGCQRSGKATQTATHPTKAFEDHPPHRRYHAKAKSIAISQATKVVIASQSNRIRTGCGGRSGRKKQNTSTVAITETHAIPNQVQIAENISSALRNRRPEAGSLAEFGDRVVQFRRVPARNHDEWVLVEIADAQQFPVRQAMFGRKADHQLFLEQRLDHRVFKDHRPAQKSDVQRVICESSLLLRGG